MIATDEVRARAFVTLTLPYPISANRYWASRCIRDKKTGRYMALTYVTTEAKQYKSEIQAIARASGIAKPFDWRVETTLELYPHRPQDWQTRQRKLGEYWDDTVQCIDLGNCEKVLSDALQGIIFTDDKWIWDMRKRRMEPDANGARIVVRVSQIAVEQKQPALFDVA
jgi:crossover junction endodeoxyribonuclease RusA